MARTGPAHQFAVVSRLAARALMRRVSGKIPAAGDFESFSRALEGGLSSLSGNAIRAHRFVRIPANRPPWHDSGIDLTVGETVTVIADGRVNLSRLLDIWVAPPFQLWLRISEQGPIFRGTRRTHTFTARESGRLWLASYFPGEWADESGRLVTDPSDYEKVSGELTVLILRWRDDADMNARLVELGNCPDCPRWIAEEAARNTNAVTQPDGWHYLWYLGPGEIYWPGITDDGRASICCHTHQDVGILRRDANLPLAAGTSLAWSWKVDELPIDIAEDTLPSHDYVSIAVEFDDGQDITYYWSAALPLETVYRCPLPTWKDKETHVVVRSGTRDLGHWVNEERDLFSDYNQYIGGPARRIVRVWLIANSLFQRRHGRCEYAGIVLRGSGQELRVT
jgi:hypothetical protein